MTMLLSLWGMASEVQSIDAATAWKIIVTEGGVIAVLAGWIGRREVSRAKEQKEVYEAWIKDMKANTDLVKTFLDSIGRPKKGA
jgi:hypothetical protein